MSISLADISEFQSNIEAPQYLAGGHSCVIVRAHNGWRKDNMWPVRRDYLRKFNFVAIGWYQYLVAGRNAAQQAQDFIATVGPIRPNEFLVLDYEEGSGAARAAEWFHIVDTHYGKPSTLYSGEYFGNSNLGGWTQWKRPRWVAAYQSFPPPVPHELWQNTDRGFFPGIGNCDGSIFNGTAVDFARVFAHEIHKPGPKPAPKPPNPPPTPHPNRPNEMVNLGFNAALAHEKDFHSDEDRSDFLWGVTSALTKK